MPAEDAVFTAAVARDEVRKSLNRMEYHLSRGDRGLLGVKREVAYLDALGRQSARLGAGANIGAVNVGAKLGLGERAKLSLLQAQAGNGARAGKLKSSVLAEFSQDTMDGARQWTRVVDTPWVWVANGSACAACLANHGTEQQGEFVPMHPSCLCWPANPGEAAAEGIRQLTDEELVQTLLDSNNPEFASIGRKIQRGQMSIAEAAEAATRRSSKGLRAWNAARRRMQARVSEGVIETAEHALKVQEDIAKGLRKVTQDGVAIVDEAALEASKSQGAYRAHPDTTKHVLVHNDDTASLLGELYTQGGPFKNAPESITGLARQEMEAAYERMHSIFGDSLLFEGEPTFRHLQALIDMNKYSDELLQAVQRSGVKIHFTEGGVSNADRLGFLDEVTPKGYPPGTTWADSGGAFVKPQEGNARLVIGNLKNGSHSVGAHEMGHAIDDVLGLRSNSQLISEQARLFDQLPDYYRQGAAPGNEIGVAEFVAEAFSVYVDGGAFNRPPWYDDILDATIRRVIAEAGA